MSDRIKPSSRSRDYEFSKFTIAGFALYHSARPVRMSHVDKFVSMLNDDLPIDGCMVINHISSTGVNIILDGQHRYRAILKYLENHPDGRVHMHAEYYEDLTEEQQLRVYHDHASGIKETTVDRMVMCEDQIPVLKAIRGNFPVMVGHGQSKNAWNSKFLVHSYMYRNKSPERTHNKGMDDFIRVISRYTVDDANRIAEFCVMHQKAFGDPGTRNPFCSLNAVQVLMKLYFHNVDSVGHSVAFVTKRMCKLAGDPKFINAPRGHSQDVTRDLIDYAIRKLNRGLSKNRLEQPSDDDHVA